MNRTIRQGFIFRGAIASLLFFMSSFVWAGLPASQGTIVYGPLNATPVPLLSGPMLIVLALLLATIGYRVSRQTSNDSSRMMILSLISIGALVSGMSGVKLINEANASGSFNLTIVGGGEFPIQGYSFNTYINDTGITQEIKSVTTPDVCPEYPENQEISCKQGTILPNGQQCVVDCTVAPS